MSTNQTGTDEELILRTFVKNKLGMGRMLSGSKTDYRQQFPGHKVVFNAVVISELRGKVWWGDLDINLDAGKLRTSAVELNDTLHIIRESDARFEHETNEQLIKKAVWSTNSTN